MSGRWPSVAGTRAPLAALDASLRPRIVDPRSRWLPAAALPSIRNGRRDRSWTSAGHRRAGRWSALPILRARRCPPPARGCCGACGRLSCVCRKVLEQFAVRAAECLGPRCGTPGRRIDLDDRAHPARIRHSSVAAGAEEAVHAARGAEVLDPDVDAHGAGTEQRVEVFDTQLADD